MSDPFLAEIRIFACKFAPRGWAVCDGQLLSIAQNSALFSLLGTYYGGDGRVTFGLPNLQGSVPVGAGQGPGLSFYELGQTGGEVAVTLTPSELPRHVHQAGASQAVGVAREPGAQLFAAARGLDTFGPPGQPVATMAPNALADAGGSQPHNNMQPYLTVLFCIALDGLYPPRA